MHTAPTFERLEKKRQEEQIEKKDGKASVATLVGSVGYPCVWKHENLDGKYVRQVKAPIQDYKISDSFSFWFSFFLKINLLVANDTFWSNSIRTLVAESHVVKIKGEFLPHVQAKLRDHGRQFERGLGHLDQS